MRGIAFVAFGLLGGFVLGGIAPRRELHAFRSTLREESETVCEPNGERRAGILPGFDQILRASPAEPRPDDARAEESSSAGEPQALATQPLALGDAGVTQRASEDDDERSTREAFRLAAEVQAVRAAQTRAALIEGGGLSDVETVELDRISAQMNEQLLGYAEEIEFIVLSGEEPPTAEMLGIVHDVTGVLHDGQIALDRLIGDRTAELPAEGRAIWNLVDLEALERALDTSSGSP